MTRVLQTFLVLMAATPAVAHDTWLEVRSPLVRTGDVAQVNLMLGNHGNAHGDFKLAGKISIDRCTLEVQTPGGGKVDLKPSVIDAGFTSREGFWTASIDAVEPGLHTILHSATSQHGSTRSLKFAKSYFVSTVSLDTPTPATAFDQAIGQSLEIIPLNDPTGAAVGSPIRVRVDYKGEPLSEARVSFVPRGAVLAEGFDENSERRTDTNGVAEWTPGKANDVLIVVHHKRTDERGEGYEATDYSATLVIQVHPDR